MNNMNKRNFPCKACRIDVKANDNALQCDISILWVYVKLN